MRSKIWFVALGLSTAAWIGSVASSVADTVPPTDESLTAHPTPPARHQHLSDVPGGPLRLAYRGIETPYEVFSAFLLPGEDLSIEVFGTEGAALEVAASSGDLHAESSTVWTWEAPAAPGLYTLSFETAAKKAQLNAFVSVPYEGQEVLNGFRIGRYQQEPLKGNPAYERPRGLIEVTPELAATHVSPHFRLGQFLCKQDSTFPKYLALQERLLLKLEALLARVNERGIHVDTFHVMSGYRTPFYNARIGNETVYSRHGYGDAADIFIDRNRDGRMDDLNGNGRSEVGDAALLLSWAEDLDLDGGEPLPGGLGLYGPKRHRGPFVHIDARGYEARWRVR